MRGRFVCIYLLSVDNKLVFRQDFGSGTSSALMELPEMSSGIYFLHVVGVVGEIYVKELLIP